MNKFCIFILTFGRPFKQITLKTLKKLGVTAPIFLICSDDDKKLNEYRQEFGDMVKVFNKKQAIKECNIDLLINDAPRKTIIYARCYTFKIAEQLGYKYFIQLDDDYSGFYVVNFRTNSWYLKNKIDLQSIFQKAIDYYAKNKILLGFSFSQGGDFIGGISKEKQRIKRKAMNSFFCDIERPLKFKGAINEDVNFYIDDGAKFGITMQIHNIKLRQEQTQKNKSGMTEVYLNSGTYIKSFYSVLIAPSAVKIGVMGNKNKRIHHKINYNRICPKILREEIKNEQTCKS